MLNELANVFSVENGRTYKTEQMKATIAAQGEVIKGAEIATGIMAVPVLGGAMYIVCKGGGWIINRMFSPKPQIKEVIHRYPDGIPGKKPKDDKEA
jgi:hypothetical protein